MKHFAFFILLLALLESCSSKKDRATKSQLDSTVIKFIDSADQKYQQGDGRGALAYYDKAILLNPKNSGAYCKRGMLKVDLIDEQGALADFTKAIELDSKNVDAYFNRALLNHRKDNRAAASDYTEVIKIDSKNSSAYHNRGLIKEELGDLQGALQDFSKAIELEPKDGMSYLNRAQVKDSLKDYHGAVEDYTKALENDPNLEEGFFIRDSYFKRGIARYKAADYLGAIEDFTKLLIDENIGEDYYWRGMAKIGLKQIEAGCLDLSKASERGFQKAQAEIKKNCK